MPPRDRLLALLVALLWGVNFTAIHLSLQHFPPLFLAAARFALIAVPTLLLVPRPAVPWRWILGYGTGFGVLQFAFLYLAMDQGMPAGLASLVLQSSAPFTVVLAGLLLHEALSGRQWAGLVLAVLGLTGIALYRARVQHGTTVIPVLLTVCGGLGWAIGNLCSRQARTREPFRLMLWMTVVPPLPLAALSLAIEGPHAVATSLATAGSREGLIAVGGLLYTVLVATLGGSGLWTALMSRHPSSTVAPYSLLVPVAGIASSWVFLGQRTSAVEIGCGVVVVAGVLLAGRQVAGRQVAGHRVAGRRTAVDLPAEDVDPIVQRVRPAPPPVTSPG
jgi:O-acetylserine/cysteine efflux transporter